jgi:hypothetical protein
MVIPYYLRSKHDLGAKLNFPRIEGLSRRVEAWDRSDVNIGATPGGIEIFDDSGLLKWPFQGGAHRVILKPLDFQILLGTIQELLASSV